MAVAVRNDSRPATGPDLVGLWRKRIDQARDHRRRHEPIWLSNLAFAAGQQWLIWDDQLRRLRHIAEVDDRYADRELYTADKINELVQAQLGELSSDDDRPELLLAQESSAAEEIQRELNECAAHGWEHEWDADSALTQVRRLCLKLGVAAVRVRFDPTKGREVAKVPTSPDGQPILDPGTLDHLQQTGTLPDGSLPRFKPVHEGRTVWEPLSAFNLLTPPGVNHEDMFPWEIVMRPVLIDHLIEEYGEPASSLTEDTDIASVIGVSTAQALRTSTVSDITGKGRLRDHCWLFTAYERPCRSYPNGQVVHLASNQMKLLRVDDRLPYETVNGEYRSGIHYFHWWRLDDRFESRAFIEPLKDPQRLINRRETQNAEIIDRGMPKVFVQEGAIEENPAGLPLEVVEMKDVGLEPHFFAGIGPGNWMYEDLAHHADNLAHASTISPLRLGEQPKGVNTYAQLALLNENESAKRSTILQEHKRAIGRLLEDSMCDVRRYWPEQKQILVAGDDGNISQKVFAKSRIPDFYIVRTARGAAQPRSQGAELTKVDAIWAAARATGVVLGPNGPKWAEWYARSLDAGQALELPSEETNSQVELANYENYLMVHEGETPEPAPHDVMPIHIPAHREALDQARAAGDVEAAQRIQQHIDMSTQAAAVARKAWRVLDPTDVNDMASDVALDEDHALRENDLMMQGIPLNPDALADAEQQLRQGVNPETGQQLDPQTTSPDQIQQLLERAALKPTLVENLVLHMERHGKVIKSALFEGFPDDVRRRFRTHFDLTRELWLSIPLMPQKVEAPRVSLALRESVGPSTIASVLHRAGVPDADPQALQTEAPLENMVETRQVGDPKPPQEVDEEAAEQQQADEAAEPAAPPAQAPSRPTPAAVRAAGRPAKPARKRRRK